MLLNDEQYVIKWLSQYGALPKTQVLRLLRDKSPDTAEKIIRNLKREQRIADVGDGYYLGLDHLCKPDQRVILAVWVLLKFIDYVDPMAHYPATYPSQVFFLKENVGYEVVVLYNGEQHLTKLLQPQDEETKYILVLPPYSDGFTVGAAKRSLFVFNGRISWRRGTGGLVLLRGGVTAWKCPNLLPRRWLGWRAR